MLAPTNDAIGKLGESAMAGLTNPSNISQLANLVKGQIVPGKLDAAGLAQAGVKSASGQAIDLAGANLGEMVTDKKYNIIPIDKVLGQ